MDFYSYKNFMLHRCLNKFATLLQQSSKDYKVWNTSFSLYSVVPMSGPEFAKWIADGSEAPTTRVTTFQPLQKPRCPKKVTAGRTQPWTSTTLVLSSRKSPICTPRGWWATSHSSWATPSFRHIASSSALPVTSFKWCSWIRVGPKVKKNGLFFAKLRVTLFNIFELQFSSLDRTRERAQIVCHANVMIWSLFKMKGHLQNANLKLICLLAICQPLQNSQSILN